MSSTCMRGGQPTPGGSWGSRCPRPRAPSAAPPSAMVLPGNVPTRARPPPGSADGDADASAASRAAPCECSPRSPAAPAVMAPAASAPLRPPPLPVERSPAPAPEHPPSRRRCPRRPPAATPGPAGPVAVQGAAPAARSASRAFTKETRRGVPARRHAVAGLRHAGGCRPGRPAGRGRRDLLLRRRLALALGIAVRIGLERASLASAGRDGLAWIVTLADTVLEPPRPVHLTRASDQGDRLIATVDSPMPARSIA